MGKSTISMAMFNSYVKLSEGTDPALRSKNHTPDSNQGHTRTDRLLFLLHMYNAALCADLAHSRHPFAAMYNIGVGEMS